MEMEQDKTSNPWFTLGNFIASFTFPHPLLALYPTDETSSFSFVEKLDCIPISHMTWLVLRSTSHFFPSGMILEIDDSFTCYYSSNFHRLGIYLDTPQFTNSLKKFSVQRIWEIACMVANNSSIYAPFKLEDYSSQPQCLLKFKSSQINSSIG